MTSDLVCQRRSTPETNVADCEGVIDVLGQSSSKVAEAFFLYIVVANNRTPGNLKPVERLTNDHIGRQVAVLGVVTR